MKIKVLSQKKKSALLNYLNSVYELRLEGFVLLEQGEKIFIMNENAFKIAKKLNIKNACMVGFYFGKMEKSGFRLSFDATQLFANQIKGNIIELNESEAKDWLFGLNIKVNNINGYFVLKYKDDFVGCGFAKNGNITNFVPKERRIKKSKEKIKI